VERLVRELSIPPLLAGVLWARGVRAEPREVLHPPLTLTPIPELLEAAARLAAALAGGKRILIHGDYDADGISGTAVLTLGLRALGGDVTPFIPNRLTDGYGVHPARVSEHAARADLFLTVDCGISNHAEVRALQAAGLEVIVTDHHHPGQRLPDCLTVHPSRSPHAQQGLPELTGAGVAYHLLWALHEHLGLEPPVEYSDLASIGTIADVAPLMGENRALVTEGLRRLADSRWPGLKAMVARTLSHAGRTPTAQDVAFTLAPRLNAAGRLGEADLGLELLLTASERRALELSSYLDARNNDRRKLQDEMLEEALKLADPQAPALVLERPNWHPGVMGIVASKLLDRFYKPVYIVAKGKGSVRSPVGISAVAGLEYARDLLERFGGHSQAAGFAIREGQLEAFRGRLYKFVEKHPPVQPQLLADTLLSPDEIDADLLAAVARLEPYGTGHPTPLFALTGTLEHARGVGQGGKHLQLRVGGIKGVSWNRGHEAPSLALGRPVNAAVSLRENTWQGRTSTEFLAEGVRLALPLACGEEADPPPFYRGAPPADQGIPVWNGQDGNLPPALWLRDLPRCEGEPLKLLSPSEQLVRKGATLYFDFTEETLGKLEALDLFPTLSDLRRAFVTLQRSGQVNATGRSVRDRNLCLPFSGPKADLCKACLEELDLLDAQGRVRKGQKRDPYSSPTFVTGLMEGYKLRSFLKAYRALEGASFACTVAALFGEAGA